MKSLWLAASTAMVLAVMASPAVADHGVGIGANYWRTLDDIKDNPEFDRSGVSYYLSYQYKPIPVFFLEAQLERMPDGFMAAPKEVYAPQAYVGAKLLFLYAAAGVGIYYSDGDWSDDPFYTLRAGLDLTVLPMLHLDVNANYRFTQWSQTQDEGTGIDTDSVFVGAAVRFVF